MNIIRILESFQTQEQSLAYLEKIRWQNAPYCPYCASVNVGRHASTDRKMPRWQCRDCSRAFAVTVGTLFHGTHIALRNWFLVLALMLNAKETLSASQIARDLDMRRATVWSMMQRIQAALATDPEQKKLLYRLVEAEESGTGGNPRRESRDHARNQQGRRTKKTTDIGTVKRQGRAVANARDVSATWESLPNHSARNDGVNSNPFRAFWRLMQGPWRSMHRLHSQRHIPLYVTSAYFRNGCPEAGHRNRMRMFVGAIA